MLRGNIAATSLKMLWKNLYSVKCYAKSNLNVFTISLWEIFWRGLIYFDQFICYIGLVMIEKTLLCYEYMQTTTAQTTV